MNPPPRRAKIPSHIDASKLPTGVWWSGNGNGCWMLKIKTDAGKWQSKRIAGPQAILADIWQGMAAQKAPLVMTLASLSTEFQDTPIWRRLATSTQHDYQDCHIQICNTPGTTGKLGDLPLAKWTIGLVRKYRDKRGESSASRANKELAYIKRVFSWAYEYEKTQANPADGVKKLTIKARQHYAEDADYQFMLDVARTTAYWYVPLCMELAYRCRMRLSEVLDLTDANELPEGLLIKRRKGSRDNIVRWTDGLRETWQTAINRRNQILLDRKQPHPIKPDARYLFISERTGDRIQPSSLKTALARIGSAAEQTAAAQGIQWQRFTFHDLKRKGISDTTGNKQDASGHRQASMLNVYDVKIKTVDPAGEK
jgi:site-specific recombinase XerD